jgi:hypothetical protein
MGKVKNSLVLLLAILAGCANLAKKPVENTFSNEAYYSLVSQFSQSGLYNSPSPLFDFNDPKIIDAYDKTINTEAKSISRDIKGVNNIVNAVESHIKKYKGQNLIIISGAAFHIYGAADYLEEKCNAEYISITPKKLDFRDILVYYGFPMGSSNKDEIEYARMELEIQFQRANGVVRNYGSDNLKTFVNEISDFGKAGNIVVGIEETGLHSLYTEKDFKQVYGILEEFIKTCKPTSILYLGEDFCTPKSKAGKDFLNKAKIAGIPANSRAFLSVLDQ